MKFGFDIEYRQMMRDLQSSVEDAYLPDKDLYKLGRRAVHMIKRRTKQGKDADEKMFKPYSDAYSAYRERHGRNTDKVDLSYTGKMMASLTAVPADGAALVRFKNSNDGRIANYHNSLEPRSKIPLRRFLDVVEGTDDYKKLAKYAAKLYAKAIES